jgi:adenylosuccinate lyase
VINYLSRDINDQNEVKSVFAIAEDQHILLSDAICGYNGIDEQFGSSAEELEKYLCDRFGFDEKNISVEQIKQFF